MFHQHQTAESPREPSRSKASEPKRAEDPKAPASEPAPTTKDAAPSEPETQSPPPPKPATKSKPPVPADMGIGGAQHQATQKRIKEEAEALGFLATIEKPIPNGSVDLLLERGGQTIACEISVTTTIDHEFGNVKKCLDAGFGQVAVISKPERLRQIADSVNTALGAATASRVSYYTPDDFVTYLRSLVVPAPATPTPPPTETIRRGRKVKVKARDLSPQERREKEAAGIAMITEIMRQKLQ